MKLDWGRWKSVWAPCAERVRTAVWAGALGLLGLVLAVQAERAGREGAELTRRSAALDRDLERLRRANQALRDEVRALETDPLYVESLLRRWKMVGGGERLVE
jgi:cell division protein FtsB